MAINTFIEFREAKTIFEFTDYIRRPADEKGGWEKENLEFQLNHLQNLFEYLNEEINQIIHTSNDKTINFFFEELKSEIKYFDLSKVDKDYFKSISITYNNTIYEDFMLRITEKENSYFDQPERKKYKHLEKYSRTSYGYFSRKMETYEEENKNFYCVEEIPKLIDFEFLERYLEILERITEKFNESVCKEINLYDQGKLSTKTDSTKLFYDKIVEKFKNNKIAAILILLFVLYVAGSQILKLTIENKQNINKLILKDSNEIKKSSLTKMKIDSTKEKKILRDLKKKKNVELQSNSKK
ncbi:hypothetical protein L0669_03460 [Flavobacterium bizetiae]|uniref:hypothetical protein n=1 Tax=Flavobacterium bizetiae TaxID=2704140 RepID=UPI0021E7AA5E|nr:hypothetical protein [Flavobacterium bizetiae]UTN04963.1 hypothetical protein L0669_03460 [Flavobacterium bizetiae]